MRELLHNQHKLHLLLNALPYADSEAICFGGGPLV